MKTERIVKAEPVPKTDSNISKCGKKYDFYFSYMYLFYWLKYYVLQDIRYKILLDVKKNVTALFLSIIILVFGLTQSGLELLHSRRAR
jgi:hypothetical protein